MTEITESAETTIKVSIGFPNFKGLDICKIEIHRGEAPIFLETKDKHGVKTKRFYIRSGNRSAELPIDEASEYIKRHFNGSGVEISDLIPAK